MNAILARAAPDHGAHHRIVKLTALFWASSYVLLAIRGSIFFDDWGRLLDSHRALAVTVGAGVYALALKRIESGVRITLRSSLAWIVVATVAVMVVRVALDELLFDIPQGIGLNLLWSLTWSAYFGLWVMASLAFLPAELLQPAASAAVAQPRNVVPIHADNFDLLAQAMLAEASELKAADRSRLAERIVELGGYECADGLTQDNDRARLALTIATRLSMKN